MDHMPLAVSAETRWRVLAVREMVGNNHWHIASIRALCAKGLCLICHRREYKSRVVAKSSESGEPVFTFMDVLLYGL
jgi:hypothetical protein